MRELACQLVGVRNALCVSYPYFNSRLAHCRSATSASVRVLGVHVFKTMCAVKFFQVFFQLISETFYISGALNREHSDIHRKLCENAGRSAQRLEDLASLTAFQLKDHPIHSAMDFGARLRLVKGEVRALIDSNVLKRNVGGLVGIEHRR